MPRLNFRPVTPDAYQKLSTLSCAGLSLGRVLTQTLENSEAAGLFALETARLCFQRTRHGLYESLGYEATNLVMVKDF